MKFRAKLTPQQTQLLYNVIHPISRLQPSSSSSVYSSPSTILYLDNERLVLSTRGGSSASGMASTSTSDGGNMNIPSSANTTNNTSFTYTQSTSNDAEGIFCFAELNTKDGIFRDLIIQSVEEENAILMEINIAQLKTALRGVLNAQLKHTKDKKSRGSNYNNGNSISSQYHHNWNVDLGVAGPELSIKLKKMNGGPHLCLDVKDYKTGQEIPLMTQHQQQQGQGQVQTQQQLQQQLQHQHSSMIVVHHAIPVRMMRVVDLQHHVPPRLSMPDVQLELPRDRPVKTVVDRLKMISPHIYLEGSMKGLLTFQIDGDGASVRTTFTKLTPIHEDCKQQQQQQQQDNQHQRRGNNNNLSQDRDNDNACCTVKVDSKKLHASLHWQGTLNMMRDISSATLCMWENEMLVLDISLNPNLGRFMYYVPVHFLSSDWN